MNGRFFSALIFYGLISSVISTQPKQFDLLLKYCLNAQYHFRFSILLRALINALSDANAISVSIPIPLKR